MELPSLAEQKVVASILRDLDDKIEVNNEINKNLLEQALAIYKEWFCDYALSDGTLPENWKITTIDAISSLVTRGIAPKYDDSSDQIVLNQKCIRDQMCIRDRNKSKKVLKTQFSYNPLWKMLIDRGLKKRELQEMSEVSATSIAKLGRNENVTTEVLLRICESLDCDIQDIMERIPIKHDETAKQEGQE